MRFDSVKVKGNELIEELNKLIGKNINLSFGSFGGVTISGVLEEKEQKIDRIYNFKINDATLNIFDEGEYELKIDDTYVEIGFNYFVFIKEV